MEVIFTELASAAGRKDLLHKLRTADLPADRKEDQFAKLKRLRLLNGGALRLVDSRFVGRFADTDSIYLCIHTEGVPPAEQEEIEKILGGYGASVTDLDESTFLFLTYYLNGLYRVRRSYLSDWAAENVITIADEPNYVGHEIDDVINWFESITLYAVPPNSILTSCSDWFIAATLATSAKAYRADRLPGNVVDGFKDTVRAGNVNPESIYYGLTSTHWRQCFLEIYKCLENIYYLPWVKRLKYKHGYTLDGLTLAKQFRSELRWRHREAESISELFTLLEEGTAKSEALRGISLFADLDLQDVNRATIGRRIYKIRNVIVHGEDFDDPTPLEFYETCWSELIAYLLEVTYSLYVENAADTAFNYLTNGTSPDLGQAGPYVGDECH